MTFHMLFIVVRSTGLNDMVIWDYYLMQGVQANLPSHFVCHVAGSLQCISQIRKCSM